MKNSDLTIENVLTLMDKMSKTGLGKLNLEDGSFKLSILKSSDGDPSCCQRFFYTYDHPLAGEGRFIHTYQGDGNPLPSFEGEPEQVAVEGDIDSLASAVWDALDEANRISLFVRFTDLETRDFQQRIVNKYSGKETQA